mmetsp:Transcript_40028/g.119202  ORF Transcript_40028/g.119202 Transcript_40028/m.119202 type:complete len:220 (-) Transcript_40028:1010-1669(-)
MRGTCVCGLNLQTRSSACAQRMAERLRSALRRRTLCQRAAWRCRWWPGRLRQTWKPPCSWRRALSEAVAQGPSLRLRQRARSVCCRSWLRSACGAAVPAVRDMITGTCETLRRSWPCAMLGRSGVLGVLVHVAVGWVAWTASLTPSQRRLALATGAHRMVVCPRCECLLDGRRVAPRLLDACMAVQLECVCWGGVASGSKAEHNNFIEPVLTDDANSSW